MTQTTVTHSDTDRCQTPMYTCSDIYPQFPTISLTHTYSRTDIHTQTEAHGSANTHNWRRDSQSPIMAHTYLN